MDEVTTEELRAALTSARERIAQGWTTGELARDSRGTPVNPWSPSATCWCISGAVAAGVQPEGSFPVVAAGHSLAIYLRALDQLQAVAGRDGLPFPVAWNDHQGRTLDDVLALLDQALANLGAA